MRKRNYRSSGKKLRLKPWIARRLTVLFATADLSPTEKQRCWIARTCSTQTACVTSRSSTARRMKTCLKKGSTAVLCVATPITRRCSLNFDKVDLINYYFNPPAKSVTISVRWAKNPNSIWAHLRPRSNASAEPVAFTDPFYPRTYSESL